MEREGKKDKMINEKVEKEIEREREREMKAHVRYV